MSVEILEPEITPRFKALTLREAQVLVRILDCAELELPGGYQPVFGEYDKNIAGSFAAHLRRNAREQGQDL